MHAIDELEDSFCDAVFFGPISDKERKMAQKLVNRKTEVFNFKKENCLNKIEMSDLSPLDINRNAPIDLSTPHKEELEECGVQVINSDLSECDDIFENISPSHSKYSNHEEFTTKFFPPRSIAKNIMETIASEANQLPASDINRSLEGITLQDMISSNINGNQLSFENSLPQDLCDLVMSPIEDISVPTKTHLELQSMNNVNFSMANSKESNVIDGPLDLTAKHSKKTEIPCLLRDSCADRICPTMDNAAQLLGTPAPEQSDFSLHTPEKSNSALLTPTSDNNRKADMSTSSFEFMSELSYNNGEKVVQVNSPKGAKMSLSFSKDEMYYEENMREHFNLDSNIFKCGFHTNVPSDKVAADHKNYFDTLELIDISSECDDVSEGDDCSFVNEQQKQFEDLTEKCCQLTVNNGSSYVSDGSQNYAVLLSKSEEVQHTSLSTDSDISIDNLDNERIFNDTIEEMDLLLKYGAAYFQEGKKSQKHKKLSEIPKITLNEESILSPCKESVSSINEASFTPPCNSTQRADESYESVTSRATFTIATPIKSLTKGPPPIKPPRKAKSPDEPKLLKETPVKTSKKISTTPSKRKRIPTYTLKPKIKSPRTPYNTPSFKIKPTFSTPLNVATPAKPYSAISLFKPKSKLTPYQPKAFLTPQLRSTNSKPLREYKSPLSCESETLHRKIRGLSIVSPVAKYLQNNPPPPLITTIKPKSKINPRIIEKELSPLGGLILKESNKTPSKSNRQKKMVLPPHSYTTSSTQLLEKENINTRREILTNNPPTSITKHIGRYRVPKNASRENTPMSSVKDQSMMEISVCENISAKHSHTLR